MTASVILTTLPGDAKKALEKAASSTASPAKGEKFSQTLNAAVDSSEELALMSCFWSIHMD
jgi:hypothetical protein